MRYLSGIVIGMGLASQALAAPSPVTPGDIAVFQEGAAYVFRNSADSKPLYTFDRDQPAKSNCTGACAEAWPPVVVGEDSSPVGDWTIIRRADAVRQWAFRGRPVYTYAKDSSGRPTGDGVGNVWRLIASIPVK